MITMKTKHTAAESTGIGEEKQIVFCQAPTRIDFAGGTLDVWPVAEMLRSAAKQDSLMRVQTLNAGLELFTRCRVAVMSKTNSSETTETVVQVLVSDEHHDSQYSLPRDYTAFKENFPLVAKVFRHFQNKIVNQGIYKITVHSESDVPRGSGLGGSSSLFVCLIAAFESLLGNAKPDPLTISKLACDLEAGLLGGLAGIQDHLGAAFGGVSSFLFGAGGPIRLDLGSQAAEWIEKHCILALSQDVHHSGSSNWQVLRSFLNGDPHTLELFLGLAENAESAATSLLNHHFDMFQHALSNDWKLRSTAFPSLSTQGLDLIMKNCLQAGAQGAKVCGAAAGGVILLTYNGATSARDLIISAIEQSNARTLPLKIARSGLRIESERKPN